MSSASASSASSAKRVKPRTLRRVARIKGNRLVAVSFSRGLKATFDSPVIQRTSLPHMTRVSSSGNKKIDLIARDLMHALLTRSKALMRHSKREGLDIDTLHDAFRLILPNDTLGLVEGAHLFGMERVQQYRNSLTETAPDAVEAAEDAEEEEGDEEDGEEDEMEQA